MNSKTKSDAGSLLRIPKLKNKLGLKINKIAMPHDDLITPEATKLELPSFPGTPLPPPANKQEISISPMRDFTKVANSIVRDAVPNGLFKGTSKSTYDALYQRTRGAITPVRTIKAVQSDLISWTNVSQNTLRTHLKHLQAIGLVKIHYKLGDNRGQEYEVSLPEEIEFEDTTPYPLLPPPTPSQKLVPPPYQKLVGGGRGFMPENIGQDAFLKTSLKTKNKNDDDTRANRAFSAMIESLDAAHQKITGRSASEAEAEKWANLADLLILELEIAASRVDKVSSVPAFLTEVLRRRLFAARQNLQTIDKSNFTKASKTKIDTVGKSDSGAYKIKPLDETEREEALSQLKEFADEDFLPDFKKWYVAKDWEWLMNKLEKSSG